MCFNNIALFDCSSHELHGSEMVINQTELLNVWLHKGNYNTTITYVKTIMASTVTLNKLIKQHFKSFPTVISKL